MSDFAVYFGATRAQALGVATNGSVVVWPVDQKWNDFGYGLRAAARVRSPHPEGESLDISLMVIPEQHESKSHRFDVWLQSIQADGRPVDASTLGKRFLTILRSLDGYRELSVWAQRNGVPVDLVLRPLRDLVYFRSVSLETDQVNAFLLSDAARVCVFRNEATFTAWHRGAGMLRPGAADEELSDVRSEISFETTLPGFGGPHSIRMSYGVPAPLSDRCHALIGKNGAGKTQLLRELIIVLARRIDGTNVDPFAEPTLPRGRDSALLPTDFRVNRIVVMAWDASTPLPDLARLDSRLRYLFFSMRDEGFGNTGPSSSGETQTAHLVELFRDSLGSSGEEFKRLHEALRPLFDASDLAVAVRHADQPDVRWVPLRDIRGMNEERQLKLLGEVITDLPPKRFNEEDLVELSSGERTYLAFGIRCAARVERGTFLILDEPETHLHPALISGLMRVLSALLEATKSIALVATHSPFIVRELPSRCVHVVRLEDDRTPMISSAYLRTLGASVDALAANIFDDAETAQVNVDIAKKIARSGKTIDEIREEYGRELSAEMLSEIRQLMRDSIK